MLANYTNQLFDSSVCMYECKVEGKLRCHFSGTIHLVFFLKTEFVTGLELTKQAIEPQESSYFCFPSAGITWCHHTWLLS